MTAYSFSLLLLLLFTITTHHHIISTATHTFSPPLPPPDLQQQQQFNNIIDALIGTDDFVNWDDSNNEESSSSKLTRSHFLLPTSQKQRPTKNKLIYSNSVGTLSNAMSCKSFSDLELEEVKGLMDLGFIFKKEQINPRMIRVLLELQRLAKYKYKLKINKKKLKIIMMKLEKKNEEEEEEEIMVIERSSKKNNIMRLYLSEAWLIRRPNSPLLNLKVPREFAAVDMKKHLRFWARIVASKYLQLCS